MMTYIYKLKISLDVRILENILLSGHSLYIFVNRHFCILLSVSDDGTLVEY